MTVLTVDPSPARRSFAVVTLVLLALIVLTLGLRSGEMALGYRVFMIVVGAGAGYFAWAMWQATSQGLVLDEDELRESGGRVICALADIEKVERGTFAFKPSNGFLIRVKTRQGRVWAPGLWWRMGRVIGVGGATSASQAKALADVLAARISGAGRID
ncbi:hypothetical protein [Celeribacter arenosi]|uniref:Integral membrane protein n=1 Tax=Celeribacter arenosi TaxID=792649 RepID=A0ABP7JTP3_9RHOB